MFYNSPLKIHVLCDLTNTTQYGALSLISCVGEKFPRAEEKNPDNVFTISQLELLG